MNFQIITSIIGLYFAFRQYEKSKLMPIPDNVKRWDNEILSASSSFKIDRNLIAAIITVESSGDPFAIGDNGSSIGLMQIQNSAWLDSINHNKLSFPYGLATNPKINIFVGTGYLKYLFDTCSNNWQEVVKAYNQGCVGKSNKIEEANQYLSKIKKYYIG